MDSLAELIAHRAEQLGNALPEFRSSAEPGTLSSRPTSPVPQTSGPTIPALSLPASPDLVQIRAALLHIRHDINQLLAIIDQKNS